MTNFRETAIARIDFATDGTELDDIAWSHRRRSLMQRLYTQLSVLRQLMASTIKTTTELAGQRTYLVVYLQESAQTPLRHLTTTPGGQDLYLQDLRRVREQQAGLPERFEQAIRSPDHPVDAPHIGELRQLLWQSRREGRIQLHSSLAGEWKEIPHLPHTLPGTSGTCALAQILRISRTEVRALLLNDLVCPLSQRRLFKCASTVNLHRHRQLCDLPTAVVLATLMQQQTHTGVAIEIEYNWVDGQPHRLTLVSIQSGGSATRWDRESQTSPF